MSIRITHVLIAGLLTACALTGAHAEGTQAAATPQADGSAFLVAIARAGHIAHGLVLDDLAASGLNLRGIGDLDSRIGAPLRVSATGGEPPAVDAITVSADADATFGHDLTEHRVSHLGHLPQGLSEAQRGEPLDARPDFGLQFRL